MTTMQSALDRHFAREHLRETQKRLDALIEKMQKPRRINVANTYRFWYHKVATLFYQYPGGDFKPAKGKRWSGHAFRLGKSRGEARFITLMIMIYMEGIDPSRISLALDYPVEPILERADYEIKMSLVKWIYELYRYEERN